MRLLSPASWLDTDQWHRSSTKYHEAEDIIAGSVTALQRLCQVQRRQARPVQTPGQFRPDPPSRSGSVKKKFVKLASSALQS